MKDHKWMTIDIPEFAYEVAYEMKAVMDIAVFKKDPSLVLLANAIGEIKAKKMAEYELRKLGQKAIEPVYVPAPTIPDNIIRGDS